MVRPGPKSLPSNVRMLHRPHRSKAEIAEREQSEVRPRPLAPARPKDLSPLERECWDLHAPELERLALLTPLDAGSFRLLVCQPYEVAMAARRSMLPTKADGTPDGRRRGIDPLTADRAHGGEPRRHPAFLAWHSAVRLYLAGAREFGLTPSARVGLRPAVMVGDHENDDEDDFEWGT